MGAPLAVFRRLDASGVLHEVGLRVGPIIWWKILFQVCPRVLGCLDPLLQVDLHFVFEGIEKVRAQVLRFYWGLGRLGSR